MYQGLHGDSSCLAGHRQSVSASPHCMNRDTPGRPLPMMNWENPSTVLGTFPVGELARTIYPAPVHLCFVSSGRGESRMKGTKGAEQWGSVQMGLCRRCQGLMVPSFTESLFLEVTEAGQGPSWRCVNCGEWLDQTILSNRLQRPHTGSISTESEPQSHRRRWRRYASPKVVEEDMCDQSQSSALHNDADKWRR